MVITTHPNISARNCFEPPLVSHVYFSLLSFRIRVDGSFFIRAKSQSGYAHVFCHMTPIPGCGDGGWTLVMKLNGSQVLKLYLVPVRVRVLCNAVVVRMRKVMFRFEVWPPYCFTEAKEIREGRGRGELE